MIPNTVLSLFPSSLPDVLCDPTDLIWRKWAPFEAMTGRTAPSSDGLVAEVLKYNYLFWLITIVPFKIDLESFPRSAFVFINTSSARLASC